jgi:hypothetical protein
MKTGLLLDVTDPKCRIRMSGEEFMELFRSHWLRSYLVQTARAMAKRNQGLFEELVQEAWLRIDLNLAGSTLEHYAEEGFRAMQNYYQCEIRQWRLTRRSWCEEPVLRRTRTVAKRYFKKGGLGVKTQDYRRKSKTFPVGLSRSIQPNTKSGLLRSVTK